MRRPFLGPSLGQERPTPAFVGACFCASMQRRNAGRAWTIHDTEHSLWLVREQIQQIQMLAWGMSKSGLLLWGRTDEQSAPPFPIVEYPCGHLWTYLSNTIKWWCQLINLSSYWKIELKFCVCFHRAIYLHCKYVVVSRIFWMFTPKIGEMIQFHEHIFQMGWNDQRIFFLLWDLCSQNIKFTQHDSFKPNYEN